MILAGDIGGTKTNLALFEIDGDQLTTVHDQTFPSREHGTFDEILDAFLKDQDKSGVESSCFGVAGAVFDGRVHTTNLPWTLEESDLARSIGCPRATLLNDLEAAAYAMPHQALDQLHVLNAGTSRRHRGNIAVIAAGTGLGEAILFWNGTHFVPIASEGGHADFAARTDVEIDLLRYLRDKYDGHVSFERILSGPGLANIYRFFRDTGHAPEPDWLAARFAEGGDPGRIVSEMALDDKDANCSAALDLFAALYGAEAGNLALKALAMGGVFLAGGIAAKVIPALTRGDAFLKGFFAKGRFTDLMKNLHVSIALDPKAPLQGAAYYASDHRDG